MSTRRTVFRNGTLFDGHRYRASFGAVVVEAGRIAAVHEPTDLREAGRLTGPGVIEVDLAGGLLAPGFVDAHVHVLQGGLQRVRCDLSELQNRAEYLTAISEYAARNPHQPWILGSGWAQPAFPGGAPSAADLDGVVADRPVFLPNRDHHGAWVNSRALELAGIDENTPDPPHGRIERDHLGRPSGTLHEAAMRLVSRMVPPVSDADSDQALLVGQRFLHSMGVVGWQEAIVGEYAGISDPGPAYRRLDRRGELTADVVGALWWDRDSGPDQVERLVRRRAEFGAGRFRATSVKIMQDGVVENRSAAMDAGYLDPQGRSTADLGHSFLSPDALRAAVSASARHGFQVHVHAIGDRAVREALDAFASVSLEENSDLRHHIAHLQLVAPADVGRFGALGVTANMQAFWACLDAQMVELTLPLLTPERAGWQYPFGDLHRAGTRLAMGSDWPVSTPDPLAAIHVAVNRLVYGGSGPAGVDPFLPSQALPAEVAFAAYTSGSAWLNHRDEAGVIAPGRIADLVTLDRDPFAASITEIGSARVTSTWIDGFPVFTA